MLPIYDDVALRDSIDAWRHYGEKLGQPSPALRHLVPDFLIIGAPKAGTSWLFSVLAKHPDIFIPGEKELHYFTRNWRRYPIDGYLRHFAPGAGRLKGEATTNYCRLPSAAIEVVRQMNPNMKLLLLVRDPVDQAWSFMKHLFRYREANFRRYQCLFENLSEESYLENVVDDVSLSSVSHQRILERWLKFFPRENFWLGSLEEIARDPEAVYRSAVTFLGLTPLPADRVPLAERINEGSSQPLTPRTAALLRTLHRPRARHFVDYAKRQFAKDFEPLWGQTLQGDSLNEPRSLARNLHGWDVVLFAGRLWGYRSEARDKVSVTADGLVSHDKSVAIHVADFNYELQRKLGIVEPGSAGSDEEDRLERASAGLPLVAATFVMEEVEELGDYYCARMLARAEAPAKEAEQQPPIISPPVGSGPGAKIVDAPLYVSIRKDLWPPQPWMAPLLEQKGLPPVIFVAADRESLRRKLAPFARSTGEPIIEETYRGYNIIRLRHHCIAVKQALGAIDLSRPLEQLAQEFDADDFMTDSDIGSLRVQITEAAGRRNTRSIFGELHAQVERLKEEQDASVQALRGQLATLQESLARAIENASVKQLHDELAAVEENLASAIEDASAKQLREQLAAVQENLTRVIENAPGRRAARAMRRLLGRWSSSKPSQNVRAVPGKSPAGGL